jgi:hypothetical protein
MQAIWPFVSSPLLRYRDENFVVLIAQCPNFFSEKSNPGKTAENRIFKDILQPDFLYNIRFSASLLYFSALLFPRKSVLTSRISFQAVF